MAQLLQYVSPDPAFLLQRAAAGFLVQQPATEAEPFPTPSSWLIVRHGGLRDELYALAWQRGVRGWFDPPLCTFSELPDALGHTRTTGLGELERAVLLDGLLRARPESVLNCGGRPGAWIEELDGLVGALASEDVAPATFRAALQAVPERDKFERTRDDELADVYQAYLAALADAGRRDGRDDVLDAAHAIAREPAEFARRLGGRRDLRILGLMDLRGGWRGLIRALVESPALDRVELYTMQALELPENLPATIIPLDSPAPQVVTTLFLAPDPEREAEEVARRVRERIDAGASPSQIAVLAREARPTLDHVVRALERCGVPAHVRRRRLPREVPVVRDATWWSESTSGVVVAEASAAAYRSFDLVFLVGLANGAFPARPHPSHLFSVETSRVLAQRGLPFTTPDEWLAHEGRLFQALLRAPRLGLVLSAPRCDELGEELGPSAFFEQTRRAVGRDPETIHSSQVIILPLGSDATRERGAYAAGVEHAREAESCSPWSGRMEDPAVLATLAEHYGTTRIWQPTELEQYAKCPFAYFSGRLLELERREEPEEQMDRRVLGRVRHEALRRVFARLGELAGGPVYLLPDQLARAELLVVPAVDEVLAADVAVSAEPPALAAITRVRLERELIAVLRAEVQEHAASFTNRGNARKLVRTGVVAHELVLDNVALQTSSGETLRIRGALDRLETGVDDRVRAKNLAVVVEYKSTEAATPGQGDKSAWDDRVVLQLPLFALALAQVRLDLKLARAEYRVLRTGSVVHRTQPIQVDPKATVLRPWSSERARLERALEAALEHAAKLAAGAFPPAPPPSCNCPSFCHARALCRIPGGPRTPPRL